VSVASGVDNIISALPFLAEYRVWLAIGAVVILAAINLRGVREASTAFAFPTYLFIGSVVVMLITALVRTLLGDAPVAESVNLEVQGESLAQAAFILLILRSFASGCAALTGVEAISNGVPAFRRPKILNAQRTLMIMGGIAIVLFSGLVAVAIITGVRYLDCTETFYADAAACTTDPQRSLIAQVASATFGNFTIPFFVIQGATALVLLLAANTAFNGFPLLGSVLAADKYAPKSLSTRGDRLIFSNGVIALSITAIAILAVFQADLTTLIQLYIIGVFVSFTLGQSGMVKHWIRMLRNGSANRGAIVRGLVINLVGAAMTLSVLVIVTVTKFTHGAWIVFVVMPILWFLMLGVNRYYRDVDKEIEVDAETTFGATGDHAIVLVSRVQKPVLKALDYAIAARHQSIEAVHVAIDDDAADKLDLEWAAQNIKVPLHILESPYRDISAPLIQYLKARRKKYGAEVITIYTPQFIVGHWWENILHNHKARRIRHKLMLMHGVVIALVPWLLDSSDLIYGRRSRPLPGQERRGEPVRPPRPIKREPIHPGGKVRKPPPPPSKPRS
jgi:amino acid transporter